MFLLGVTLMFRPLLSSVFSFGLRIKSWNKACQFILLLALACNLLILSIDTWMEYTGYLTLFYLTVLILFTSFLVLIAEAKARMVVGFCLKNYWFFAVPLLISLWSLGLWLLLWSYIGKVEAIENCVPDDKLQVICDIQNAEDLVATPDQRFLIAPEFVGIAPYLDDEDHQTGRIMMIDLSISEAQPAQIDYDENVWGASNCLRHEGMLFSSHGIDLKKRNDNAWQLAVINHFPSESVEMFELVEDGERWKLIWRGCVPVPKVNYLNDISLSSDGSFFVSHMYEPDFSLSDVLATSLFKNDTGYVMRWDSETGFAQVPGTAGAHPNGVVYDDVRGLFFISHTFGDKIASVDILTGNVVSSFKINSPDNLVLVDDGLWVTSWDHSILDMVICEGKTPCALPFSVYRLEPSTLKLEQKWSFNHTITGLPTVALPVKDGVWIGSIRSDRVVHFDLTWP